MKTEVSIRAARAGESAAISALAIASKAHWGYPPEFMAAAHAELSVTEAQLADPSRHTFVAQARAQTGRDILAGYYAIEPLGVGVFDLDAMFVSPAFIGRGVGRALLDHARALAASLGASAMMIQSDPNATAFYEAAGAVQVALRESGSIPGRMLPELRLELVPSAPQQPR